MSNTKQEIRNYIVETFLFGQAADLADDTSFLAQGIIDSTGIMELVAYLEQNHGVKIRDDELIPENLDSINAIADFLARKENPRAS